MKRLKDVDISKNERDDFNKCRDEIKVKVECGKMSPQGFPLL